MPRMNRHWTVTATVIRTHDESVWRLVRIRAFPQRVAGTRRYPPQSYYYALLLELRFRSWR